MDSALLMLLQLFVTDIDEGFCMIILLYTLYNVGTNYHTHLHNEDSTL